MPYTADTIPEEVKALPERGQRIWLSAFNSAYKAYDGDEAEKEKVAFRVAWSAVKKEYERNASGEWVAIAKARVLPVSVLRLGGADRVVVELGKGLGGDLRQVREKAAGDLGVVLAERGGEPAALYFPSREGWTVEKAVAQAKHWAREARTKVLRAGVETDDAYGGMPRDRVVPFNRGLLRKYVADPVLAKKRMSYGEVLAPYEVDTQGDIYTPAFVEKVAHDFLAKPTIGVMHAEWGNIGRIVESAIARPGDPDFGEDSWWIGVEWGERVWKAILNDEITGFSIGGTAKVTPIDLGEAA